MTIPADFFGIAHVQQASISRSFFQPAANDGFEPKVPDSLRSGECRFPVRTSAFPPDHSVSD
ncbi:hypothetical protein, partial [Sulfitobacter sp. TMED3]|uniref:hypothetical protein n=1 Tax=Sulfitobacter sp. TMED3 TaxID=1986591 RepID=UPI00257EB70B